MLLHIGQKERVIESESRDRAREGSKQTVHPLSNKTWQRKLFLRLSSSSKSSGHVCRCFGAFWSFFNVVTHVQYSTQVKIPVQPASRCVWDGGVWRLRSRPPGRRWCEPRSVAAGRQCWCGWQWTRCWRWGRLYIAAPPCAGRLGNGALTVWMREKGIIN